jgi:phosphoglycolate phosphatase-like HAD superfamily hydrolase
LRQAIRSGHQQPLRESSRPLAEVYRTALLGMDGVVCRGVVTLPHAVSALAWARRLGLGLAFAAGPGSRTRAEVSALLHAVGLPVAEDDVTGDANPGLLARESWPGGEPCLVIGDRLGTDIDGANRSGLDSMLVLTGQATVGALLAARPPQRPTYVAADLRGLLDPHPRVRPVGSTFTCRSWSAWVEHRTVTLHVVPTLRCDPVDGVRAMCHAAWHSADAGAWICPERSVAAWLRAVRRCERA